MYLHFKISFGLNSFMKIYRCNSLLLLGNLMYTPNKKAQFLILQSISTIFFIIPFQLLNLFIITILHELSSFLVAVHQTSLVICFNLTSNNIFKGLILNP